jgi:hypothetical protein
MMHKKSQKKGLLGAGSRLAKEEHLDQSPLWSPVLFCLEYKSNYQDLVPVHFVYLLAEKAADACGRCSGRGTLPFDFANTEIGIWG